jgi:hypothetical protein
MIFPPDLFERFQACLIRLRAPVSGVIMFLVQRYFLVGSRDFPNFHD